MSAGRIHQGHELTSDVERSCDVCIVGSGAGGSVLAAGLAERGLSVVVLEEGGAYTNADFDLLETTAYPQLYQERATRATVDSAITILQGRSVGGSTTVNWTTCYRTPDRILEHWQRVHGIEGYDTATLTPHWEAVERRLNIHPWPMPPNANNDAIRRGAQALGWEHHVLRRNVNGCVNSGYCGFGCPVNGKQAMHLTYLPDAMRAGADIFADTRAVLIECHQDRAVAVHAIVLDRASGRPTNTRVIVRAKVFVSSGGAINGPALLQRSGLNNNGHVGRRTFLHPVIPMPAIFDDPIEGWAGAPQSVGVQEFVDRGPDKIGFFIEAAPTQPALVGALFPGFGSSESDLMAHLPHLAGVLAIHIDGVAPGDQGGTVTWTSRGRIEVDYPVRPALAEAFHASHRALARLLLAAGAHTVQSNHAVPVVMRTEADINLLDGVKYGAHQHSIATAHQMGGCAMGPDPATSVVDLDLRHHRVHNLFCVDGSVLPTALGVNPSQTIYGIAHRATDGVATAV